LGTGLEALSPFNHSGYYIADSAWQPRVLYARTVELEDGVLLATWENYSPEPPLVYFPIFRSIDGGETWKQISEVTDQVNGWGLRYQPFLYEMPASVGKYPAGTILCSGNSIPTDLSKTKIDVYASVDKGYSWEFVSHVASGGATIPDNGVPAIWEPFIMWYDGRIVLYYSDQRDPAHGQKLVHQVGSLSCFSRSGQVLAQDNTTSTGTIFVELLLTPVTQRLRRTCSLGILQSTMYHI
jgi:hypothetical protein